MLTVRVIASLKPESRAVALEQLTREAAEVPERFDGCERFEVFLDSADPDRFLLYEEWADEDAFAAYRDSDYFRAGGAILHPTIDGSPDSAYYAAERVGP